MTKIQLIKKLQKMTNIPDNAEVMIQERACENAHVINSVTAGWYIDDGMDAPEVIGANEDPKDFDIDPKQPKVIVLE